MRQADIVAIALVLVLAVAIARLHRFYCCATDAREVEPTVTAGEFVEIEDSPEVRFFRVAMGLKRSVARKLPLAEYQTLLTAAGETVVNASAQNDDVAFARSVGKFLRLYYTSKPIDDAGEPGAATGDLEALAAFLGSNPDDLMNRITELYYRRDMGGAFFDALENE
jgi:hypothetical protein